MKFKLSLVIFRRDLRLHDNTALLAALEQSEAVIPCFIFDPRQISEFNAYRSYNAMQFMRESLYDLKEQLHNKDARLYFFYGIAHEVIEELLLKNPIDAVFINEDYTPFSCKRDDAIERVCGQYKREFLAFADLLLNAPGTILKDNGEPYTIFTPYFKKAAQQEILTPQATLRSNYFTGNLQSSYTKPPVEEYPINKQLVVHGGSVQAYDHLHNLKQFAHYAHDHDMLIQSTTHLSAYIKFGCVSIREVYHRLVHDLGQDHPLIRQLYWRDFFTQIAAYFPHVFSGAFHSKYDKLPWQYNTKNFERWCAGTTGFPVVDAGMRELNATGYMHNRARLIVSSFLTKDLHISWRWGEKYFAQQLVDYDPCVNNGNWQWAASTGCDAQPYFRIFNPWLQQKKFDPACEYIKKWIPELRTVACETIHKWHAQDKEVNGYPLPMLDHARESEIAKKIFKNI